MERLHRGHKRGCVSPCLGPFLLFLVVFLETCSSPVVALSSEPSGNEGNGTVVGNAVTCTLAGDGPFHVVLEPVQGRNSFSITCTDGGVLVPAAQLFTNSFCSVLSSLQVCFNEGPDYRGTEFFDGFSSTWWEGDPRKPQEGMTFTIPLTVFPEETKTFELGCLDIAKHHICRVVVSARSKARSMTSVGQAKTSATVAVTGSSPTVLTSLVLAMVGAVNK
ncbi:SRS domain-containing protein [Neospora caninum Liverpool]|uniref:SRS domain-containing protein n=1 Tax=Neospora caninum (strain Liverpool) TaxID=572307 RepID=F0VN13_NEOCL|nr:SRS domain-containing protein [Neospora caninum Liverpool]CBZ55109.1 SRS domain-containing protein [Neospora caninum Liverpool]CEL69835.1 TPA: SRS domain-containing protein [Neospora caninum Liverpool]|eukprot:XP_003885137.1 SRS domain-containing protein [Neospora caninum Liverpool]